MQDQRKTKAQLIEDLQALRARVGAQESSFDARDAARQGVTPGEQLFRTMVETANDIIYTILPDGTFTYVSPNWKNLLGHEPSEVTGTAFMPYVHPEDLPACLVFLEKVMKTGKPQQGMEYRVRHKDGSYRWHMSNASVMNTPEGELQFAGIARDITKRKLMELDLQKTRETLEQRVHERTAELEKANRALHEEVAERESAEDELRQAKDLSEAIIESMPGLFYVFDAEARLLRWNANTKRISGRNSEKMEGASAFEFFSPDDHALIKAAVAETFERGEGSVVAHFLGRKGERLPYLLTGKRQRFGDKLCLVGMGIDMSEQKQAEESLAKSDRIFRALAESMNALVLIASADQNRAVYANKAAVEVTGYSLEELTASPPPELFSPASREKRDAFMAAYARGEELPDRAEMEIITKQGQSRWLETSWALLDMGDEGLFKVTTSFDITDRREAELSVVTNERRFRALAESTPAHVFITQAGRFTYANKSLLEYHGMDMETFCRQDPMEMLEPNSREAALNGAAEAIERGESRYRFQFEDSRGRWFESLVTLFELDAEQAVMGNTFDITEHKQAEQKLRESEANYRTIFDVAGAGMINFGQDRLITLANDEWCELTGYSKEEIVGKMTWMPFFTEESLARMKRYHEKRSKDPTSVPRAYEAQMRDRAGKIHDGIINIALVPGTQQRVASFQDMTALKQAQRQMFRADKMAALGQIIAGVAHEINNPNNFIYFNLPILKRYIEAIAPLLDGCVEGDPDLRILNMPYKEFMEDIFKLLGNMEHGSARITEIVSELKTYISSHEEEDKKPGPIDAVIGQVMTLVGKQVRKMVKNFEVEVTDDLPKVLMNAGKIEQVLINLVINAGQAADKADSRVRLSAEHVQGQVEIRIEDNGAGIDGQNLDLIFDPFFTTKGREAGSGLGLAISRQIVEDHGGTISVESRLGQMTTFVLRLPALAGAE